MLRWLGSRVLDAVLPRLCLSCEAIVDTPGLCATCWPRMRWIAPPLCEACGLPFELGMPDLRVCAACAGRPPALPRRIRAALVYGPESRDLVLGFKHADRLDAAPCFARWMRAAGAALLTDCDLLVPVPLHWTRLAWRRYNQAALLARLVARDGGRGCIPDLLVRRRRTPPQGEMGAAARQRNVAGAFAVRRRHAARVEGRRVLLVDDVLTSGATLGACAAALARSGAASVDALVLMRAAGPLDARRSGKIRPAGLASEP